MNGSNNVCNHCNLLFIDINIIIIIKCCSYDQSLFLSYQLPIGRRVFMEGGLQFGTYKRFVCFGFVFCSRVFKVKSRMYILGFHLNWWWVAAYPASQKAWVRFSKKLGSGFRKSFDPVFDKAWIRISKKAWIRLLKKLGSGSGFWKWSDLASA